MVVGHGQGESLCQEGGVHKRPDQRDREDTLAARRFRLLAPLAVLLALAALTLAPGIIG
jgi:hypothetical protein